MKSKDDSRSPSREPREPGGSGVEWLDELTRLEKAATAGPWEFRSGCDVWGDSRDLLMAEVGLAGGDEDAEYAEVLFGGELGSAAISANWDLLRGLRNAAPRLIAIARQAAEFVRGESSLCVMQSVDRMRSLLETPDPETPHASVEQSAGERL